MLSGQPSAMPAGDATWLNPQQRARDLAAAGDGIADVLVIGAGITGAGAALDAASRGLCVTLVEAGDIASGTSSRSGKTFHGGLRYLEQGNFGLVRDAIAERDLMLSTLCPHIAWPEAFVYPLTRWWEWPYVGAGVAVYDFFGRKNRAVPRRQHFGRKALGQHLPALDPGKVIGGIAYHDALMDDARHTLAVVRTAAGLGARVLTQAPVVQFLRTGQGHICGVQVRDEASGRPHSLRAQCVINAAGVWADAVQRLAGANTFRIQPAKGVHLLLPASAIAGRASLLARASDSVIIARRWYGYWLVGTTDTAWHRDKGQPVAEREDIRYLLDNLNRYLTRPLHARDVLGVFAGLRPLLQPPQNAAAGTAATSAFPRDHAVLPGPPGLTTIVGGKYTTYRRMAADAVDAALRARGMSAPPSRTAALPLIGAPGWQKIKDQAAALASEYHIPEATVRSVLSRHGDRAGEVLSLARQDAQLAETVPGLPRYLLAELAYAALAEGACHLYDALARRLHLNIELPDGGVGFAPRAAAVLARCLGWSEAHTQEQIRACCGRMATERAALEELQQ